MSTYSFLDTNASIVGPGGAINLGAGAANSEEGISIEPIEPANNMVVGADGHPMHSLSANKSVTVTVNLLKTSPVNQKLMAMYNIQTASSSTHGINTISIVTTHGQDVITIRNAAFRVRPSLNYSKNAGINSWVFDGGIMDAALGADS